MYKELIIIRIYLILKWTWKKSSALCALNSTMTFPKFPFFCQTAATPSVSPASTNASPFSKRIKSRLCTPPQMETMQYFSDALKMSKLQFF